MNSYISIQELMIPYPLYRAAHGEVYSRKDFDSLLRDPFNQLLVSVFHHHRLSIN